MNTDNITMSIVGDMKIGDWITLAAVIVALILGLLSLVQTQRLRRSEFRERLLNEIIAWTEGVRGWAMDEKVDAKLREAKNPCLNQGSLSNAINRLITALQTHSEFIGLQQMAINFKEESNTPEFDSAAKEVAENLKFLYTCSDKVIEEATKIKSKL